MGGYGSGRQVEKYFCTVEECYGLDINKLLRDKWLEPRRRTSGIIKWHVGDKEVASIGYEGRMDLEPPYLRLYYTWHQNDHIDYKVCFATSHPNYGGVRYWFLCPSCMKRVGKLYLGWVVQRYFSCRKCQRLTYQSCRESHHLDALIAKIRQPAQSRAEALRNLKEFRETLLTSWSYRSE